MLDVNIIIPPMVEDIVRLEPQFPEIVPDFSQATVAPLAVLTPLDIGSGAIVSGEERLAAVSFQIDVYDTNLQRCTGTALALSARLISRGFVRNSGADIKEDGLHRRTLTFSAAIDEHTGQIYRRNTWNT